MKAPKVVVACGGEPDLPAIPGIELAINSDGFFDLETQPKKAVVVGAGYIAVEMAGIFAGLGTETHLCFRGATVLRRGFDPFIVESLMEELEKHGPSLHKHSLPVKIEKAADGTMSYTMKHAETGEETTIAGLDCVLMAIGRRPVTDLLNIGCTGVELNEKGEIKVDKFQNTNVEGVYALGDVSTSGYELTPVAIAAGRRLGDRLFGKEPRARIAYEMIATVVFTHPPIGTIGLTEPQAQEEFGKDNIRVQESRMTGIMAYAFNEPGAKPGFSIKLVLKLPEERIVGLHLMGPGADEMLQGFAVAIRMGATRADFEASMAIHPTIAEEIVTMGGWGQVKQADGSMKPQLPPYLADEK